MRENAIYAVLFPLLDSFLAAEFPTMPITCYKSYNPTQQGVNSGAGVYVHRIGATRRYGSPLRRSYWDGDVEKYEEKQILETPFQVDALLIENPKTATSATVTACDIIDSVAGFLQSAGGMASLRAAGLSIYRITDIRLTYITDDRNRDESSPSFDFTLQHESVRLSEVPIVSTFEAGLYPI
jgi:hypothetical protein